MTGGTASGGEGDGVPLDALLGDDGDAFERVVAGDAAGPLAVTSAPFGGGGRVLDAAAARLGATRIDLDPGDGPDRLVESLGDGPLVVSGCQHLYERTVGGFEPLDRVLDALAGASDVVVAGWNRYAWSYLAAVRGLDGAFAERVAVGPASEADIAAVVLGRYDDLPEFVADAPEEGGLVAVDRYTVGWRDHTVSLPVPRPNAAAISAAANGGDIDPKDVVFERLAAVSRGNVGVATAIWEARRGEEVRPSDIAAPGRDADLDREEAFCLRIVLAKERVERTELDRIIDGADRVLGRLRRAGLVAVEGDVVRLAPAAVPTAAAETDRRRIL